MRELEGGRKKENTVECQKELSKSGKEEERSE